MNSKIFVGLSMITVLSCSSANAFDTYVGLDIANNSGELEPKDLNQNLAIDVSGISYGLTLGATISKNFAIEVFYNQFENGAGKIRIDELNEEVEFKQKSYGASLNLRNNLINDFYSIATVGAKRIDVEKTFYKDDYYMVKVASNTSFKPFFGVGIGYKATSRMNIEAKYSRFEDMNTIGGTFVYRF